jgi:hypothetical protein
MQALSNTLPRKATGSSVAEAGPHISFGPSGPRVEPLDELARKDEGYGEELAYLMSVVSAWAYSDEKVLASKLRYYGLTGARIRRVAVQNNALLVVTTAYLIQSASGKTAILAFRGTDPGDFITVLTDGQVMLREFRNGRVHSGFFLSVEVVWDEIHESLMAAREGKAVTTEGGETRQVDLPDRLESLYVTGHSLGGAMAVLAAARLFGEGYEDFRAKVKGIYTFGQPMVGDRDFATSCEDEFQGRLHRHVFQDDIIPHLPPRSALKYAHSGGELRASRNDVRWRHTDDASGRAFLTVGAISVLLNAVESRISPIDFVPGYSIDDHMPIQYVEACRKVLDPSSAALSPQSGLVARAQAAGAAVRDQFQRRFRILRTG